MASDVVQVSVKAVQIQKRTNNKSSHRKRGCLDLPRVSTCPGLPCWSSREQQADEQFLNTKDNVDQNYMSISHSKLVCRLGIIKIDAKCDISRTKLGVCFLFPINWRDISKIINNLSAVLFL
jgi:hypothetical protein